VIEKELVLKNRLGLHARAAAKLVQTAGAFSARVTLRRGGDEVDAKSILGLLFLGASQGTSLVFRVDGGDEKEALAALENLIDRRFDESS
jgi:phosphocarrier protein HPr